LIFLSTTNSFLQIISKKAKKSQNNNIIFIEISKKITILFSLKYPKNNTTTNSFLQIISKKAKITILFLMKYPKNNNIIFIEKSKK
jgi:hypothetical protein